MTGPARILFVGLDACDPATALDLAAAGRMPALTRLLGDGARAALVNPFGLFVGALWMTFATGLRPDRHRFHSWDEIDNDSYRRRLTTPTQAIGLPFWQRLSAAGRRIAVLDVPHSRANVPIRGLQLAEWGCHDRHFGFNAESVVDQKLDQIATNLSKDSHSWNSFVANEDFHHALNIVLFDLATVVLYDRVV